MDQLPLSNEKRFDIILEREQFVESKIRPQQIVWQTCEIVVSDGAGWLVKGTLGAGLVLDFGQQLLARIRVSVGALRRQNSAAANQFWRIRDGSCWEGVLSARS